MQDNTLDFNAKAAGIDMSGAKGELHLHSELNVDLRRSGDGTEKPPLPYRWIAGIKSAIDPEGFARQNANASLATTDGWIESIQHVKQAFPYMSDKQAALFVGGYYKSPEQAENIFSVMDKAENILKEKSIPVRELLPSTRDEIFEGASKAYDVEIQELWAKVLAGEMESPGQLSKSAMATLSSMNRHEAKIFEKLCQYSTYTVYSNARPSALFVVLDLDNEGTCYGEDILTVTDVISLSALGLINMTTGVASNIACQQNDIIAFRAGDLAIVGRNLGKAEITIRFDQIVTTSIGKNLSTICDISTGTKMPDLLKSRMEKLGLEVQVMQLDDAIEHFNE